MQARNYMVHGDGFLSISGVRLGCRSVVSIDAGLFNPVISLPLLD